MDSYVTKERREQIIATKKMNAALSDIPFYLTIDNVIWPEFCPALGIKLDYFRKGKGKQTNYSPSFDRLDPSQGYTPENTRIISNRANRLKNDGSSEELRKIADYIDRELHRV